MHFPTSEPATAVMVNGTMSVQPKWLWPDNVID